MILQALKEYYDRKAADPDSGIAPLGWETKELPFLVTLLPDGSPVTLKIRRCPTARSFVQHVFWYLKPSNELWGKERTFFGMIPNCPCADIKGDRKMRWRKTSVH